MNNAADRELLRGFCRAGLVLTPRQGVERSLALAADETVHDDLLIGWIESDARLEFSFLVGANLPAFGDVQLIQTVRQAVGRLGRRRISSLLWLVAISEFCLTWPPVPRQTRSEILRHSVLTGLVARQIQAAIAVELPHDPLVAGLAHNVGELLLAAAPIRLTLVGQDEIEAPPITAEQSPAAEADACRLGALLLEIWNAPVEALACARFFRESQQIEEQLRPLLALVRIAERLARVLVSGLPPEPFAIEALPEWRELAIPGPGNDIADPGELTRRQLPELLVAADHLVAALGE